MASFCVENLFFGVSKSNFSLGLRLKIYKNQFGIELAQPRPIKFYHIDGLSRIM